MEIRWLEGTSSFVAVDFPEAPLGAGVCRLAPKVLTDGAELLARSVTYALACLGVQGSGVSIGINAAPADRDGAVAAWRDAVGSALPSMALSLDPGRGLDAADLEPLRAADPRPAALWEQHEGARGADLVVADGIVAAMQRALDGLAGRRVAIEQHGAVSSVIAARAVELGAEVVAAAGGPDAFGALLASDADALLVGSRAGVIDHESAEQVGARVVVPTGAVPVTTRALAVLRRRQVEVLPDFITTAGILAVSSEGASGAALDDLRSTATSVIGELTGEVLAHPDGAVLGACERAEAFLATWRDELPFGRPLA